MRTITLEEHFGSPAFLDGPGKAFTERMRNVRPRCEDSTPSFATSAKGALRKWMPPAVDMQVLSLNSPGVEQAEAAEAIAVSREANDFLAEAMKKHPTRFAGFASLPIQAPDKAAEELERRVRQQGFKGTLINGHTRGRYLDDKFFWPILERAEALNVPSICTRPFRRSRLSTRSMAAFHRP